MNSRKIASSANKYILAKFLQTSGKSLIYITNRIGPIVPCGIPLITSFHSEKKPVNFTLCFLEHKKRFNSVDYS